MSTMINAKSPSKYVTDTSNDNNNGSHDESITQSTDPVQARMHTQTQARSQLNGGIEKPNDSDCLFGRGRRFQNHPGNRNLHRLIDSHLAEFVAVGNDGKNMLIAKVVNMVKQGDAGAITSDGTVTSVMPGRFLRRRESQSAAGGGIVSVWEEVTDVDARTKCGHTFRSRTRPEKLAALTEAGNLELPQGDTSVSRSKISKKKVAKNSGMVKTNNNHNNHSFIFQKPAMRMATAPIAREALLSSFIRKQEEAMQRQRELAADQRLQMDLESISDAELLRLADRLLAEKGDGLSQATRSPPLVSASPFSRVPLIQPPRSSLHHMRLPQFPLLQSRTGLTRPMPSPSVPYVFPPLAEAPSMGILEMLDAASRTW